MKTKLLILGILAAVAVVAVIVVIVTRTQEEPLEAACTNFIETVRTGDVQGSYNLYSESARKVLRLEDWAGEVELFQKLYEGNNETPELVKREDAATFNNQTATDITLRVQSNFGPWFATCTFYPETGEALANFKNDIGV